MSTAFVDAQEARGLLQAAVGFRVLSPGPLSKNDFNSPRELLAKLGPEVRQALDCYMVEARRRRLEDALSEELATVAPRDAGTAAPAHDDGTVFPGRARSKPVEEDGDTISPGRRAPAEEDGDTISPGRAPAEEDGDTISPGRAPAKPAEEDGATISPGRAPAKPAEEDGATISPGRRAPATPLEEDGATISPGRRAPLDGEGVAAASYVEIDPSLLRPNVRSVLENAAFIRLALERDLIEPDLAEAAAEQESACNHLVEAGAIDALAATDLCVELMTPGVVCTGCCQLLQASNEEASCGRCGSTYSRRERWGSTIAGEVSATSRPQTAEAIFEGGEFAGFEIVRRIAEGGMGIVFLARDPTLNRHLALKVMRGGALSSKSERARFLQEAEAAAGLRHESIVPLHNISEHRGYPYYTMEFVEGETIDAYVKTHQLPGRETASVMQVVADAVQHFHLRGIIHRDLKPDNILVTADGIPKIIDFGIAKKVQGRFESSESWTIEGDILGTPHYMPPEQAAGRIHAVDTRSDVYALGAILYQLLTGKPPFHELSSVYVLLAIQNETPPTVRSVDADIDPDLDLIVQKAMAKEQERRYQTAAELAADLERYANDRPILARPATLRYRTRKYVQRHLPYVLAASLCLVVLAGLGAVWTQRSRAAQRQVHGLIAQAREAPLVVREDILQRALRIDAESELALALLSETKAKLDQLSATKEAAERERAREAQRKLERLQEQQRLARAQAAVRQANQQEEARRQAEKRERKRAEQRARELLAKADASPDALTRISVLSDALVLVPPGPSPLRTALESRKVSIAQGLADNAVGKNRPGLAEYWLTEARKLASTGDQKAKLDAIAAKIRALLSAEHLHTEAKRLIGKGEWVAARQMLTKAQQAGFDPKRLKPDLEVVLARCEREAQRLSDEGRALLQERRPRVALARAREALRFALASQTASTRALFEEAATRAAQAARLKALPLWDREDGYRQGLSLLREELRAIQGSQAARTLEAELKHRRLSASDPDLSSLVYVPAVSELRSKPFFVMRVEVSIQQFKAFVDAGGYGAPKLFDARARPQLERLQAGAKALVAASNMQLPVQGVTWWEARAFARWKSKRTKKRWRLPTAREWEIAAGWDPRLRQLQPYPWGTELKDHIALEARTPRPVGTNTSDRSPFGVLDAGGNLAEWVVRSGDRPGLKGGSSQLDAATARHNARVSSLGTPPPAPSAALRETIGFRLIVEAP